MQPKHYSKKSNKSIFSRLNWNPKVKTICLVIGAIGFINSPVYALNSGGFFDRKAEGWFWYDDPVEPEEIIEPEPEPKIAEIPEPEESMEAVPVGPEPFSAAWLRDNMSKYLDIATDEPTVENVRNYMYLQRIAMDKATIFSEVSQMAVIGDPYLDETTNRPFATFAAQDLDRKANLKTDQIIKTIAERAGLFYFFDDGESSLIQAPLLDLLVTQNGFHILPISVTGNDLFNNPFGDYVVDNGHSEQLNIKSYPALYLVSGITGKLSPISQSIISLPELKERILTIARRENIISDDEFKSTKPAFNVDNNLAPLFEHIDMHKVQAIGSDKNSNYQDVNNTGFIDPKTLSTIIEQRTRGY